MIDPLFGVAPPEWAEALPDLELALQYEEPTTASDSEEAQEETEGGED
jgi:hypothetical protein